MPARPGTQTTLSSREGWTGWDDYAPFYDWENARTLGRRDVAFWQRLARGVTGRVLELGCGTGRIALPLARSKVRLVGIDRSEPMLQRALRRARVLAKTMTGRRRRRNDQPRLALLRGDIRTLPFRDRSFAFVLAPYGVLQSLLRERDLRATLASVARVLDRGGLLGIDLVPDVPNWHEYRNRVQLRGRTRGGVHLTLVESVRQDRRRHLTIFDQQYLERRGRHVREHRFTLKFRTLPVREMIRRIEAAGFVVEAVLGDYRGRPWDDRAEVWIMLARRR
jgi:SAM-dependent methyltransferase